MKSTGVTRQLDSLGRIVLPIELRRTLGIGTKDYVEIYVNGDEIVLKKHMSRCIFCDTDGELHAFKGKLVCPTCLKELQTS